MRNGVIIDEKDNVVVAIRQLEAGADVAYPLPAGGEGHVVTKEAIPLFHKIARTDIKKGDKVVKYGEYIGVATRDISQGEHVHTHNCESSDELKDTDANGVGTVETTTAAAPAQHECTRTFRGYRRADGQVGIRNHVLILPTCACGSECCRIVASQVRGAVSIVFNTGCSDVAANTAMSQKVLTGFACNPNVYGVVIIGLGCETVPHAALREKIQKMTSKPVVSFGIQDEGGTLKTIEKAVRAARDMAQQAGMQQKELFPASELLLGIECGGSDATSGIACNPAVGELSDILVDMGASAMMSESIEWIGGEHVLAKRAATPEIQREIIRVCEEYEKHLAGAGQDCRAGQPTPGNKAGGLSTLDEKSLGCIRKGGTRPIVEVLEQAVRPTKRGALVMDTAGYDISSVTSMAAAGCQVIIFTTGRGTPTGNAIVPVLKVTANERTYRCMEDNMDADLSAIVRGEKTYQQAGRELVDAIAATANGRLTKAEAFGFSDIAVDHVCRYV